MLIDVSDRALEAGNFISQQRKPVERSSILDLGGVAGLIRSAQVLQRKSTGRSSYIAKKGSIVCSVVDFCGEYFECQTQMIVRDVNVKCAASHLPAEVDRTGAHKIVRIGVYGPQ
jgi:hypothetical protein